MGYRLVMSREPSWVPLPNGAAVFAQPATAALVFTAQAMADALLVELASAGTAVTKAGGHLEGLPDISTDMGKIGVRHALFVLSLAELAVTDWRNILTEEGQPLSFDASLLAALLAEGGVAQAFVSNFMHPLNQVVAEDFA